MKRTIITLAIIGLASVGWTQFTDIDNAQYYGRINIPKTHKAIDANFAVLEGAPGAKNGATVTSDESAGVVQKTVISLSDTPVSVIYLGSTTNAIGSTKIYDFPEGLIYVVGVTVDSFDITDFPTNTMEAADGGDFSFGTAVPDADAVLNGTAADFLASTAIDPITNVVSGALAAAAQFDGTTTAKDLYVNLTIDNGDLTGASTNAMTVGGTVTVHWINLGDY